MILETGTDFKSSDVGGFVGCVYFVALALPRFFERKPNRVVRAIHLMLIEEASLADPITNEMP